MDNGKEIANDALNAMPSPDVLPILQTDEVVIFPHNTAQLIITARFKDLLNDAVKANRFIGMIAPPENHQETGKHVGTNEIGTMIRIDGLNDLPDGNIMVSAKGLRRIRVVETVSTDPYITARIEPADDRAKDDVRTEALRRRLVDVSKQVIELSPQIPDAVGEAIQRIQSPTKILYLLAANTPMDPSERISLLKQEGVEQKLDLMIQLLDKELEILKVSASINENVTNELSSKQREYHLRQQMEAIQKELGETDAQAPEIEAYKTRLESSAMSAEAHEQVERELKRMESMNPQSSEYPVIESYINWLLDLPWEKPVNVPVEIDEARFELDQNHFGMESVKERIVEYVAVRQLQHDRQRQTVPDQKTPVSKGIILCLVGPPGTGKTSLGKSIAGAMGRTFTRMSLGGIRDESEIRGHRRTYVGALPGRIIHAIKRAGTRNPVFLLDEVDKLGRDWRGDPSSALLEVLDPEQNVSFRDHYLDVDFDLSEVVFIATANQLEMIPDALRDRMDIIPLEGYTEYEKFQIAKNHLIPRQMAECGLLQNEVAFMDEAIHKIIRDYTREAGVRSLERQIGVVCRKSVLALHENNWHSIAITSDQVKKFLKKETYLHDEAEENTLAGVATGLAVTAAGGEILHIEATSMPGHGKLKLTGKLGDVMKESAHIAHSYVRSRAASLGIKPEDFDANDIHLHIPAGALPKDGPSAGVVMTLALASLLRDEPIPGHVGATGEMTLRGRILPVGGVKMKVLAAHRAGLTRVMLPERNRRDIKELPEEIKSEIQIDLVDTMDDVLSIVFSKGTAPPPEIERQVLCDDQHCRESMVSA